MILTSGCVWFEISLSLVTILFSVSMIVLEFKSLDQKKSFAFYKNDLMLDTVLIFKLSMYFIFVLHLRKNFVFHSYSIFFRSLLIKFVFKPRSCHTCFPDRLGHERLTIKTQNLPFNLCKVIIKCFQENSSKLTEI